MDLFKRGVLNQFMKTISKILKTIFQEKDLVRFIKLLLNLNA